MWRTDDYQLQLSRQQQQTAADSSSQQQVATCGA
jgi:hypothetical protein